jgi:hypothetical protein
MGVSSMSILINLDKAKKITHEKRREVRAKEFKPFDEIIAKQIPGENTQAAEAQRVLIREKYNVIQNNINSAPSITELKLIYDLL